MQEEAARELSTLPPPEMIQPPNFSQKLESKSITSNEYKITDPMSYRQTCPTFKGLYGGLMFSGNNGLDKRYNIRSHDASYDVMNGNENEHYWSFPNQTAAELAGRPGLLDNAGMEAPPPTWASHPNWDQINNGLQSHSSQSQDDKYVLAF